MTREEILKRMNDITNCSEKATINTLCLDCHKEVCDERKECCSFDDFVAVAKDAIIIFLFNYVKNEQL